MASPSSPRMLAEAPLKAGRSSIRVLIALGSPMDCQLLQAALKGSRQQLEAVAGAVSRTDTIARISILSSADEPLGVRRHQYLCGFECNEDALEVHTRWVRNKISPFSSRSMLP